MPFHPDKRSRLPLLTTFLLLAGAAADALELTRGPYLQTGTHTSVILRWRTDEPSESIVYFGTSAGDLQQIAGDIDTTTEHIVELKELQPDTRYYYSIGDLHETLAQGPDYNFLTHPVPGTRKPTRIWAIGDCGTFNTGAGNQAGVRDAYYHHAAGRRTDVWLALGDNAYFTGTDAEYQANFFDVYPTMLRQTVLWSTLGNHETYSPPVDGQVPYLHMFSFPTGGEAGGIPSGTEKYYSFNYANIHFVCLDSELSDRTINGPMLTWLRSDLEANTQDWLIAFWHSPPYTKGSHDSDNLFDNFGNMTEMRANAVALLESYGVDLVLSGHSHIYERSYLINGHYGFSSTLEPRMIKDGGSGKPDDTGAYRKPRKGPDANEGAVYVVAGSSGWATFRTGVHPVMYFDELQVGSLVLDVSGDRLDAKFLRETGAIDDYFSIIKGAGPEELRIVNFMVANGEKLLRWKSAAGLKYRVQRSETLNPANWTAASAVIVATGGTTTWRAPLSEGKLEEFYRVVQVPSVPQPPIGSADAESLPSEFSRKRKASEAVRRAPVDWKKLPIKRGTAPGVGKHSR